MSEETQRSMVALGGNPNEGPGRLYCVSLCVADLEASLGFYRDVLGLSLQVRERMDAEAADALWGVSLDAPETAIVGRPGVDTGMIRLVAYDSPGERMADYATAPWDIRFFDVCIGVSEMDRALHLAAEAGFRPDTGPVEYQVEQLPGVTLTEALVSDPDGSKVALIQTRIAGREVDPASPMFTEVATATQVVADADHTIRLYRDGLGMEAYADMWLTGATFEELIGIPHGARFRLSLLRSGTSTSGKIEILNYPTLTGRDFGTISAPPRTGLFGQTFLVGDVKATYGRMIVLGAQPMCEPTPLRLPLLGARLGASVRNTNGLIIELVQS